MKKEKLMKVIPWLLIVGGFFSLSSLPWIVALGSMVVGFEMLSERIWPEKWG